MLIWRCSNHVACCGTLCYPYAVRTLRPKTTRAAALVGCGSRYVAAYCAFVCMLYEVVCLSLLIVCESSVSCQSLIGERQSGNSGYYSATATSLRPFMRRPITM